MTETYNLRQKLKEANDNITIMNQKNTELSHENFDLRQELQNAYQELKQIGEQRYTDLQNQDEIVNSQARPQSSATVNESEAA